MLPGVDPVNDEEREARLEFLELLPDGLKSFDALSVGLSSLSATFEGVQPHLPIVASLELAERSRSLCDQLLALSDDLRKVGAEIERSLKE